MTKKSVAIGSVILVSLTLFLIINTPYHEPIGDIILKKMGIEVWSNGDTGVHLPVLYGLPLIVVGSVVLRDLFYSEYPKFRNKGLLLVVGIVTSLIILVDGTLVLSKSIQSGLNAIQFIEEDSKYTYKVEAGEVIEFKGTVVLKNYSRKDQTFYIACDLPNIMSEDYKEEESFIGYEENQLIPKRVTIPAKVRLAVEVDFREISETYSKEVSVGGNGAIRAVKIYNEEEIVELEGENIWGKKILR